MRKVAWPRRPEIRRYSIIVIVTVVIYTAYIFGLDQFFSRAADWFYA
jgi:preprotein translocase subunit SecE